MQPVDLFPTANPSPEDDARVPSHAYSWGWIVVLVVLAVATSWAVAVAVSVWLVPPYLALMAWIVFPNGSRRDIAPALAEGARSQDGEHETPGAGDDVREESNTTAPAESAVEVISPAEVGDDPAAFPEPVGLKTKRGRSTRGRKAKAVVSAPPTAVTWVQVGPGQFVRVEGPGDPVAASSPTFVNEPVAVPSPPPDEPAEAPTDNPLAEPGKTASFAPDDLSVDLPIPSTQPSSPGEEGEGEGWTEPDAGPPREENSFAEPGTLPDETPQTRADDEVAQVDAVERLEAERTEHLEHEAALDEGAATDSLEPVHGNAPEAGFGTDAAHPAQDAEYPEVPTELVEPVPHAPALPTLTTAPAEHVVSRGTWISLETARFDPRDSRAGAPSWCPDRPDPKARGTLGFRRRSRRVFRRLHDSRAFPPRSPPLPSGLGERGANLTPPAPASAQPSD